MPKIDVLGGKYPPPVTPEASWTNAEGVMLEVQKLVLQSSFRTDNRGKNLLHMALGPGGERLEVSRWIYEGLGDISAFDGMADGGTALHLACARGHMDMIRWLVEEVEADTLWRDQDGCIPFVYAIIGGYIEAAKWMLANSATDVCSRDEEGRSPLHIAAFHGHMEIVRWLVRGTRAVEDLDAQDDMGRTPMHYAALGGSENLGCTKVVSILLAEEGAESHCVDDNGMTPLHLACWAGSIEVTRFLVTEGFCIGDLDVLALTGGTPCDIARHSGHGNLADWCDFIQAHLSELAMKGLSTRKMSKMDLKGEGGLQQFLDDTRALKSAEKKKKRLTLKSVKAAGLGSLVKGMRAGTAKLGH